MRARTADTGRTAGEKSDVETFGLFQRLDCGGQVAFGLAYSGGDDPPAVGSLRQSGVLAEVAAALIRGAQGDVSGSVVLGQWPDLVKKPSWCARLMAARRLLTPSLV